jgi:hypothetical protein
MAMETHVFFHGKLPSKAALNRTMKELDFPFAIKPATGSLERQSGFMPMMLRGEETGAEFDVYDGDSAIGDFADCDLDPSLKRRASFRWGGDTEECAAGLCGTAALAKLVNGVVFDEAENRLLSVDEAIAVAKEHIENLPKPSKVPRAGSPAVLKRILAPLLAKRSDLALVGNLLVIRPVRHLVRGVVLRWHHRTTLLATPYIRPLYQRDELFLEDAVCSPSLDGPDFEPLLFYRLAKDAFAPLGQVASVEDFIESSWGKRLRGRPHELLPSILLSRGIEQAKALTSPSAPLVEPLAKAKAQLARTNRRDRSAMLNSTWQVEQLERALAQAQHWESLFSRSDSEIFHYYRAWETAVARGFKLEQVWEPSPFPAELPQAGRAAKSADPVFVPTPWLEFPDTWRQEAPERPGGVRFGYSWERRDRRIILLHPITRDEAEHRHRTGMPYKLMTRLPEGHVLVQSCRSLSNPVREADGSIKDCPTARHRLDVFGSDGRYMVADFRSDFPHPEILEMRSVKIDLRKGERLFDKDGEDEWYSFLDFEKGEKSIHHYREREKKLYERRKMTEADRATYRFPWPSFGDVETLWTRVSRHLRDEGYGIFC